MLLFDNLDSIKVERDSVLSIGAFDGVHRGHQQLIGQMLARAHRMDRLGAVLTFHPHPNSVLFADNPPHYLTTPGQKAVLLENLGLDALVILPFDRELARTPAREFVAAIAGPLRVRELWVGTDFALGRDREGDIPALREMGHLFGFQVQIVQPYMLDGQVVSSTRIRRLLQEGRVEEAARLLNRYHSLAGEVVHGAARGHGFGIPTANLQVRADRAIPMNGIYAVWAILGTERFPGVANIGFRPSFDNGERTIEIHLLDFDRRIYGCDLLVEFVKWLRPERRFEDAASLVVQIEQDIQIARSVLDEAVRYPQAIGTEGCLPPPNQSKRFEELGYTADVGIRAFGRNMEALFENAAYGMFSLIGDIDGLFDTTHHSVSISSPERESLLVDWLGELLYLHETTGEIFIRFDILEISDTALHAQVYGTYLAQPRLEIKAVTYHDLSIEKSPSGYTATVVFDI